MLIKNNRDRLADIKDNQLNNKLNIFGIMFAKSKYQSINVSVER